MIALFNSRHLASVLQVWIFAAFVPRQRADHYVDAPTNEFRRKIGMAVGCYIGKKFVYDGEADLGVRHFAAAKFQGDLHLHVFAQKINCVRQLDAEVVRINARAQLHFLDDGSVVVFLGFLFLLGDLVTVFSEIHQAADGRHGCGGDFDEVNAVLAREVQRVGELDDAELLAVHCDDPDFAGADFAVDPDERGGRRIAWGKRAAQGAGSTGTVLVGCGITVNFGIKKIVRLLIN